MVGNLFKLREFLIIMQSKILDFLMKEDEITWQTILLDLVKSGEMDTWDLDISVLAHQYLETVKTLQSSHLPVSGKILLASALLLKIKADRLLTEGIGQLDRYLFPPEDVEDLADFVHEKKRITLDKKPVLTIKTPQARKRKVNLQDLLSALDKALEVSERRILKKAERDEFPEGFLPDEKHYVDVSVVIGDLYARVEDLFKQKNILSFSELLPEQTKKAKIDTFIPLLYLYHQEKIDLRQDEAFGEIHISIKTPSREDLNSDE